MTNKSRENVKLILALATLASMLQLACAKGDDPQTIQTAPPSALATHLRSCAARATAAGQVVVRKAVPVCRRNPSDGSLQDVSFEPRYQMTHSSSRRIELQQVIALRLEDKSEKPTEAKSPERSLVDQQVLKFVSETCQPVIDQIFRRSGLRAEHQFRMLLEGDAFAPAGVIAAAKPEELKRVRLSTDRAEKEPAKAEQASGRGFHMLLDVDFSLEKGLVLKDDPASTYSGSLVAEASPELEASKLQFCGQIAMRVAENYGLTKGRDCQTLSEQAADKTEVKAADKTETKVEKKSTSHIGLMKPGRPVEDLGKVKLASDEIDEVFFPVCGKMTKTVHQR